jgi:acyl dehydratase
LSHTRHKFHLDDIAPGAVMLSSEMMLEREAMRAFARQWDPLPIHLVEETARKAGLGDITASGSFMLATKNRLLYELGVDMAVVASFGFDEVRFREPGRPGDVIHLRLTWLEKRPSSSRPDRGIAKHLAEIVRNDGTVLLSLIDTVMIMARPLD